eukprot:scaffold9664_cov79-Isochrysis_galbana.AAC.2
MRDGRGCRGGLVRRRSGLPPSGEAPAAADACGVATAPTAAAHTPSPPPVPEAAAALLLLLWVLPAEQERLVRGQPQLYIAHFKRQRRQQGRGRDWGGRKETGGTPLGRGRRGRCGGRGAGSSSSSVHSAGQAAPAPTALRSAYGRLTPSACACARRPPPPPVLPPLGASSTCGKCGATVSDGDETRGRMLQGEAGVAGGEWLAETAPEAAAPPAAARRGAGDKTAGGKGSAD